MPAFASSHSALMLSMGVSLTLTILHLWRSGSGRTADRWLATWAGLSLCFVAARWAEVTSVVPETATEATRMMIVVGALLVVALLGFVQSITGQSWRSPSVRVLAFALVAVSVGAWATDAFVSDEVMLIPDVFGDPVPTGISTDAVGGVAALIAWMLGVCIRDVWRCPILPTSDKVILLSSLGAYAAMGMTTILVGVGSHAVPSLAEYGPIVMALCLSYLVTKQSRNVELELEALVAERGAALLDSEDRYRKIFEEAPLGICVIAEDGRFLTLNRRLIEWVGSPPLEAILAQNAFDSAPLIEAGLSDAIQRCLEQQCLIVDEVCLHPASVKALDMAVTLSPISTGPSGGRGVLVIAEDVTQKRALEHKLMQTQKMESVGELAAGIAHEINNPMAYVRTNLGILGEEWDVILKDAELSAEARERWADFAALIEESLEGVDRTIAIAHDMREFAHGGTEHRRSDLNDIAQKSIRVASTRRGNVEIQERLGDPTFITGAPGQLQQVFVNLLVNAIQALGESGTVSVSTLRAGQEALLIVEDDGPGIPMIERDRLFDPFYTTKEAGVGTGLGLYVSYQIIVAHGGTLIVGDSPLGGARFEVRLPAGD